MFQHFQLRQYSSSKMNKPLAYTIFILLLVQLPLPIVARILELRGGFASPASPPSRPPVGSTYQSSLRLPVLGPQTFRLSVIETSKGFLSIDGMMKVDAAINYTVHDSGISFNLPPSVVRILQKFRTKLVDVSYSGENDTVIIKVLPPLPRHIEITLRRDRQESTKQ